MAGLRDMTPQEDLDVWLRQVASGDRRAFSRLFHASFPQMSARLASEADLVTLYVTIWSGVDDYLLSDLTPEHWLEKLAARLRASDAGLAPASISAEAVWSRVAQRIAPPARLPLWRRLLPYAIGALLCALSVWLAVTFGMVAPETFSPETLN